MKNQPISQEFNTDTEENTIRLCEHFRLEKNDKDERIVAKFDEGVAAMTHLTGD